MCYKIYFRTFFEGYQLQDRNQHAVSLEPFQKHREKEHKGNILSLLLYIDLFMGEIVTVFGICQALVAEGTMVDKILLKQMPSWSFCSRRKDQQPTNKHT